MGKSEEYIKLPRTLLEDLPPTTLQLFLTLLLRADEDGRVFCTLRTFARENKLSLQTLRTRLKKMQLTHLLTQQVTQQVTQITICNYESYISRQRSKQHSNQHSSQHTTTNESSSVTLTIPQPDKPTTKPFIPPTLLEVQTEITAKGFSVDAEKFVAYYTSNGWMVGRNKMRSWKAALLNWNKNQYSNARQQQTNTNTNFGQTIDRYTALEVRANQILRESANGFTPTDDSSRYPDAMAIEKPFGSNFDNRNSY